MNGIESISYSWVHNMYIFHFTNTAVTSGISVFTWLVCILPQGKSIHGDGKNLKKDNLDFRPLYSQQRPKHVHSAGDSISAYFRGIMVDILVTASVYFATKIMSELRIPLFQVFCQICSVLAHSVTTE